MADSDADLERVLAARGVQLGSATKLTTGWMAAFPDLFREQYVDYAHCQLSFTTGDVPDELVSRLHIVAITERAEVVVCRSKEGWRFLPGGTREPGESLIELARRELNEEAGARLEDAPNVFAAHIADSDHAEPFRPHLPHPRAYWAYAVAHATVVAPPSNPPDGEQVLEVLALTPSRAIDFLATHDPMHTDVLRLADAMGLIRNS
jgi:8-oxo-dGTP diphosphatase